MKNVQGFILIDQLESCKPGSEPLTLPSMAKFEQSQNRNFQCVYGYETCLLWLKVSRPLIKTKF